VVPSVSEDEVLEVIARVEAGDLLVTKDCSWDVGALGVKFTTEDGWRIVVFNDAGQWDYIETVEAPDGRFLESPEIDEMPCVEDYHPATVAIARLWGLSAEEAECFARYTLPPMHR